LTEDGITSLLKSFFCNYKFNDLQIKNLVKYNSVTPGDFGSLKSRIRFVPKEKLDSDYIINELVKIQDEKQKNGGGQIGFAS
jgi:hypothetical protein